MASCSSTAGCLTSSPPRLPIPPRASLSFFKEPSSHIAIIVPNQENISNPLSYNIQDKIGWILDMHNSNKKMKIVAYNVKMKTVNEKTLIKVILIELFLFIDYCVAGNYNDSGLGFLDNCL